MNNEKQVIEINGVKMEVDLRHARRIENIQVGSRVKVLKKEYDGHKVVHGVVIGFEPFEKLPTIIVAHVEMTYSSTAPEIKFLYYNAQTKDVELVIAHDDDNAAIDKIEVLAKIDRAVQLKRNEIQELEERKAYFLSKFQTYWEPVKEEVVSA